MVLRLFVIPKQINNLPLTLSTLTFITFQHIICQPGYLASKKDTFYDTQSAVKKNRRKKGSSRGENRTEEGGGHKNRKSKKKE